MSGTEIEDKKKNQVDILELKIQPPNTGTNTSLNECSSTMEVTEETVKDLKMDKYWVDQKVHLAFSIPFNGNLNKLSGQLNRNYSVWTTERKKVPPPKGKKEHISRTCGTITKKSNIYVIVVPRGEKKKTYWKNSWKNNGWKLPKFSEW